MTNTLHNYKSKGDMYVHSLGYLFEEKDWINIKQSLILYTNTIIDLEEKLAEQPEQEPVAWMTYTADGQSVYVTDNPTDIKAGQRALPLYTAPARAVIAADREKNHAL